MSPVTSVLTPVACRPAASSGSPASASPPLAVHAADKHRVVAKTMVRVGYLCVAAAAAADVCTAFVAPVGSAAGLIRSQHARISVSARSQSSALQRAGAARYAGGQSYRRQLGLQMQQGPSKLTGGGINISGEAPFEIRGFSLANAAAFVGLGITAASFFEYFSTGGAGGLSGIGFVYGIPILLVGLALKYAELPPAPLQTTPEAEALFEKKATETMRSIKSDVTRHRYGDEAHLDTTVKFLGLVMPQSDYPQLEYISQSVEPNGELGFSMVFQSKATPFKRWVEPERIEKYVSFFGPGLDAEVIKVNSEERLVAIKLTTLPAGAEPTPKVVAPPPAATEEVAATPSPETEAVATTPSEADDIPAAPAAEAEEATQPATEA